MRKIYCLLILFFVAFTTNAQELNCLVSVNSDKISGSNRQVFKTLESSISEFVNQKKWTNRTVKPQERINCAITIIVNSKTSNSFEASIQVQSTRPIFGTTYSSPVLNTRDNNFTFKYNEFDPLVFNPTTYDSNLVSTLVYYVYIILGLDADTFALNGGQEELKQAQNVMLLAQQNGGSAWINQVGKQNRFTLIDDLLSNKMKDFRAILYRYHRKGFDELTKGKRKGKQAVEDALLQLRSLHNKTINNGLLRLFFDAKVDEIVSLYSDDPATSNQDRLVETLQRISPTNNSKWRKIN
ncbi:MAG: DUF4835 family protein [Flavobacteriaceae bacterium]